ncbi:MAG: T9SS type A sorting domain-containing protein, partial [Planctomycetaceae bacterium]|nr:T9SS type A sorting domain-containing protein [Planctomycetaceae bacterium]
MKKHSRQLQLESLEIREMLAASILSAPITAYAQPDNPAEVRIDLSVTGNTAAELNFIVNRSNGSTLDPALLTIFDSTGKAVVLTNTVDGTTSGKATASLKSGVYTVRIAADNGKGNLTLDIQQQEQTVVKKSGLETLIAAAITQQSSPANWAGRAAYYNSLLTGTDYQEAASALPIYKKYPEVDV